MTTTTGKLTFDCPWCGAITPVPAERMGEHFACPECKKATKLTSHNTSDLPPTESPPDAPHLSGDRSFDCPWCGAISSVPSSHLGDRFHCGECGKETKLTSTNTRAAAITAPPPDAPHVEEGKGGRGILVAAVVAVLGVGAWLAFGQGGGGSSESGGSTDKATSGAPADATSEQASASMSETPSPTSATDSSGSTAPATAPSTPTPPAPTDEAPAAAPKAPAVDPELVRAQGELTTATSALVEATAAQATAAAAIEAWNKANPGANEATESATMLSEVRAEIVRVATPPKEGGAPPASADEARARRTALVAFVAAAPARIRVGERVHAWLASDLFGREAATAIDWRGLDWSSAGVARALDSLHAAASAVAASVPTELVAAESKARQSKEEAAKRLADAEMRVKLLNAPRDDRPPAPYGR